MKILIIGGSLFVGRHITDALVAAGHTVTHFNRGLSETALRGDVETIRGDRMRDLGRLEERRWDAVIDTCAYVPAAVELTARALATRTQRYLLISTVSVYDYEKSEIPITESSPRVALSADADPTIVTPETYGALKASCEDVAERHFGALATIFRCGLIVGPYDRTDRFTYWVVRGARGGCILAPEGPSVPMQFIDVRDVAAFAVRLVEDGTAGVFNVTGAPGAVTLGTLLERAPAIGGANADIVWCDSEAIRRSGLEPWQELPLWIDDVAAMHRLHVVSIDRARAAGLRLRALDETIADTLAWAQTRPASYVMKHGMTAEREAQALSRVLAG